MRISSMGRSVFAATMIALGLLGLIKSDVASVWQPLPKDLLAREALVYFSAFISLASGMGLLWQRGAALASRMLLAYLLFWLLLFKMPYIFLAPTAAVSYESCGETVVIVAGAWVLYASLATAWDRRWFALGTGAKGVRVARVLYSLALIAFGLSHFAYIKETAGLVPGWLPSHEAWAYFTGGAYIAAGIAVLTDMYARLAATLMALQMCMFTLLVWVPAVASGHADTFQWGELVVSWTMTAGAWVVADSYRGHLWHMRGNAVRALSTN